MQRIHKRKMSMERKEQIAILQGEFKQIGQEWRETLDHVVPEVTTGFDAGSVNNAIRWIDSVIFEMADTKEKLVDIQRRLHEVNND